MDGKPTIALTDDTLELLNFLERDLLPMNLMCEPVEMHERGIYDLTKAVFEYFGLPFEAPY